jgi:hypothetical protein
MLILEHRLAHRVRLVQRSLIRDFLPAWLTPRTGRVLESLVQPNEMRSWINHAKRLLISEMKRFEIRLIEAIRCFSLDTPPTPPCEGSENPDLQQRHRRRGGLDRHIASGPLLMWELDQANAPEL